MEAEQAATNSIRQLQKDIKELANKKDRIDKGRSYFASSPSKDDHQDRPQLSNLNVNPSEILRQQSANGGGDDGDDLANDSGGLVNSPDFEFDSRPQWDFRSRRQLNTANLNPSASSISKLGFKEKTFTFF